MILFHSTVTTPFGLFSLATDEEGFVRYSAFGPLTALRQRAALVARGLRSPTGGPDVSWRPAGPRHGAILRQLEEYGLGTRRVFSVRVRPSGTAFQQRVWTALQSIPPGTTRSYGELARALRTAPRAIGRANATNPVCLFIPCHRVIGGDGALTGFAFGNALKAKLLRHEAGRESDRAQEQTMTADQLPS